MGIHDGHRSRLKQEFIERGLDGFPEHKVLELLLFFSVPRKDTNHIAHDLIDTFGSLSGVLDADIRNLRRVPNVGEQSAILLKLIPSIAAKYMASRTEAVSIVRDSTDLHHIFAPYFYGARNEMSYLACFDGKMKLLGVRKLSEGGPNETDLLPRKVAYEALSFNATAVVLAHNHPSGVATPSDADISTTRYLHQVLSGIDLYLYDHVILADEDMVSLRDSGYLSALTL